MSQLTRKPVEWRGAFCQASLDDQTISILDTTGTTRMAKTPEELWAILVDLRRATRAPALVHEGNLGAASGRKVVERQRRDRLISQALSDPRRPAPRPSDISLSDLFSNPSEINLEALEMELLK